MKTFIRLISRSQIADQVAQLLANATKPFLTDTVLVLHDVSIGGFDAKNDNIIDGDTLETLLLSLDKNFDFVPLSVINGKTKSDSEKPRLAITFDDGYLGVLTIAQPILEKHQIPFCIGIVKDFFTGKLRPWWDRIKGIEIGNLDALSIRLKDVLEQKADGDGSRGSLLDTCRRMDPLELDLILNELKLDNLDDHHRPFTSQELSQLANPELIELAPHSVTHPWLATCKPQRVIEEIRDSYEFVRALGFPIADNTFLLPYGVSSSLPEGFLRVVQRGFHIDPFRFYSTQPNPEQAELGARVSITTQPPGITNLRVNGLSRWTNRQLSWL